MVLFTNGTGNSALFLRQYVVQVPDVITGLVESPGVELQTDDGEDNDGKEKQQSNVDQWTNSFGNR